MRPFFLLSFPILLFFACATHSYRVQGNAVTLVLRRPHASRVMLATSLDGFAWRQADQVSATWQVTLPADRSFRYFYRVDGNIVVPDCPLRERDDFGLGNCIFDPPP